MWFEYYQKLPKLHRYSLGLRIDEIFIETIETLSAAAFLPKIDKLPYVRLGIRKFDTLKILLMVLWEAKSLETQRYIALSEKINEIGRMLGGWHNQLIQQNSPAPLVGEK